MKIRLCFLSPPGSGKGTVCKIITDIYTVAKHYDVGQMLRDKKDQTIYQVQKEGGLVDSSNVLGIFDEALSNNNFILDGSPRKEKEAEYVLNHKDWIKDPGHLIKINTSKEVCVERLLKRGRFDDNKEAIEKRFELFEKETMRSIELFRSQGRLIEVDGNQTPEQIYKDIYMQLVWQVKK